MYFVVFVFLVNFFKGQCVESYFLEIAEKGAISSASKTLGIAQPALTRHTQALEESLGPILFERTSRGVILTDAGRQLQVDSIRIFSELAIAQKNTIRAERGEKGTLSITLPVVQGAPLMMSEMLRKIRLSLPDVAFTFRHLLSDNQLPSLRDGKLDASFSLYRPGDGSELNGVPVYSTGMVVLIPASGDGINVHHSVYGGPTGCEFTWISRHAAPIWHNNMIHCFHESGFIPNATVMGRDTDMMLTLVNTGMGCTTVPEAALPHSPPGVSFLHLTDPKVRLGWELVR